MTPSGIEPGTLVGGLLIQNSVYVEEPIQRRVTYFRMFALSRYCCLHITMHGQEQDNQRAEDPFS